MTTAQGGSLSPRSPLRVGREGPLAPGKSSVLLQATRKLGRTWAMTVFTHEE